MKFSSWISPLRGVTAVMAAIMALSVTGYALADSWRDSLDSFLNTESYTVNSEDVTYESTYETAAEMMAAAKNIAIKEGEEGTVVLKNNNALPLSSGAKVALFGLASYAPYCASGDLVAGNSDAVDLRAALTNAGFTVDSTVANLYDKAMNAHTVSSTNAWTGEVTYSTGYDISPQTTVGDMTTFYNNEISVDDVIKLAKGNDSSITASSASGLTLSSDTVGIVTFARAAGESNMYAPGSAAVVKSVSNDGGTFSVEYEETGGDPLELTSIEKGVIATAQSLCDKVIVLLNTSNDLMIGDVQDGTDADAIVYIGVPNDYQFTGIVNVLAGKANATGALTDTYVYDNNSMPSVQNFGGDYYDDYTIVETGGSTGRTDPRWGDAYVTNGVPASSFSASDGTYGSSGSYSGGQYIVEAEGIYVGYKYYETRYYDSIMNTGFNASSTAGSTKTGATAWDYDDEVVYPFGYGMSYYDYSQDIQSVTIDTKEDGTTIDPDGYITAEIKVTNNSSTDGYFLAQLYVQQPYTTYDQNHGVEKSAIMFLNSGKVSVKANSSETIELKVMTKYLASYDYEEAKTYILDDGTYYFTAANGSHEAVNNIIYEQQAAGSKTVEQAGAVKTWSLASLDKTTFAEDNDTEITNVVEDYSDMNSWISGSVQYLTRSDWTTFPKNYNEGYYKNGTWTSGAIKLADSSNTDDWVAELRGQTYTVTATEEKVENVDGKDLGYQFTNDQITDEIRADINNEYWEKLVSQISVNEAVGAVIHGGSSSDQLTYIENPVVSQHEGVNGFSGTSDEGYNYNVSSQTLLGSSFNPDLALEWGRVEGNSGLWLKMYDVWGTGLTQRRTPYNGRNYEYISEDPMLTNHMGYGIIKGTLEFGILVGPKHIGFNDQEHNRNGVAAYMNEQKFRETDLRGFQGGMEDANGLAVMVAFNRIGPVNACHSVGMRKTIMREEWGYKGLISTDMMNDCYYFNPESLIMATVTQVADFASGDSYISSSNNYSEADSSWSYITINYVKDDANLVNQARENLKYQLYAFANSAIRDITTTRVYPFWEVALIAVEAVSAVIFALGVVGLVVCTVFTKRNKEED